MRPAADYDALIVGGGPGGLTGALYLARFRRRVLLVDDGNSRAVTIPRSHNMPGYPDGVAGAELVAAIREQARRHGVEFASGRVHRQARSDTGFLVDWGDGRRVSARLLLVATGTSDIAPPMDCVMEAVRLGAVRYCPVCDGYEVIGKAVGVLADSEAGAREVLYLRNFTERLTLFVTSPEARIGQAHRRELAAAGVAVVADPVSSIRLWSGAVTVCHGDKESRFDALYSALGMRVHSELAGAAERDDDGYLSTDRQQQTSVAGVYAVGDVAQGLNQISVAMGGGAIAAAAMHLALGRAW